MESNFYIHPIDAAIIRNMATDGLPVLKAFESKPITIPGGFNLYTFETGQEDWCLRYIMLSISLN